MRPLPIMIKINRGLQYPSIPVYNTANKGRMPNKITHAEHERNRAILFCTDPANYAGNRKLTKSEFPFKVYKDKLLTAQLSTIFRKKCAYCESAFAHVSPSDIEHFRPKNEIQTQDGQYFKPGYYWLAGEWSNLLISCIDCNRAREHRVPGQPDHVLRGKNSQFPLTNEVNRVRSHLGNIFVEESYRLLINPCIEDPEQYFTYDTEGLIHPRIPDDERALMSIHVYALQRGELVLERKRVLNDMIDLIDFLHVPAKEFNDIPEEDQQRYQEKRQQLGMHMRALAKMLVADRPFLGMLRDYLRRYIEEQDCQHLIRAGVDLSGLLRRTV
ncbi:hypothetical protein [Pantoea agglomerans]|uniref:Uncharacterized protein n=1 Tax=Enterobacter agglomerans TaxID=549 RepID=A0ACC5RLU4_ENTAG|nr:hypothetical protein [Pantoea agglomerans]MBK4725338.1 hypothetical protein [Pantoea agglomerans]